MSKLKKLKKMRQYEWTYNVHKKIKFLCSLIPYDLNDDNNKQIRIKKQLDDCLNFYAKQRK